jgi:hypothetical protein
MVAQILETVVMARAIKLSDALISDAAVSGKAQHRSTPRQIEYWAKIGKIADENPDMPLGLVKELLQSLEEASAGDVSDYQFG